MCNTPPDVRFASMPKVYAKATLSLMECNNEKVEKRISERCLGKSKYIATAHGGYCAAKSR